MTEVSTAIQQLNELHCRRENAAPGTLNLVDGYDCEKCLNRGYTTHIGYLNTLIRQECGCLEVRRKLIRANNSGLGETLSRCKFSNFVTAEPWQLQLKATAQEFCADDKARWFFVGGQVGSGKTHVCTAICANYLNRDKELIYMSWVDDSRKLKSIATEMYFQAQLSVFKNTDVLYIDDFLKTVQDENPSRADVILAFEIINSRLYDPKKITIISSEKTLDELINLDEALMSRIFQVCGKYKLTITRSRDKNYRLKQK